MVAIGKIEIEAGTVIGIGKIGTGIAVPVGGGATKIATMRLAATGTVSAKWSYGAIASARTNARWPAAGHLPPT